MSLSVEQIEMLVNLGATAEDILAFARTNGKPARSKGAERTARWRAKRSPVERLPEVEWLPLVGEVKRRDGGKCVYCGSTEKLGADHILPLSRGGSNDISNLAACCESCNKSKGGRTVAEWQSGGADRHGMRHSDSHSDASPPPIDNNHTPPVSSNDETTRPPKARKVSAQPIAKPADVSAQVWGDFLRHRKAKRADVNDTVIAGIRRECAAAGWTLEAALAETVTRGWQSFKADWVDKPAAVQGDDFMSALRRKSQGVPSG